MYSKGKEIMFSGSSDFMDPSDKSHFIPSLSQAHSTSCFKCHQNGLGNSQFVDKQARERKMMRPTYRRGGKRDMIEKD